MSGNSRYNVDPELDKPTKLTGNAANRLASVKSKPTPVKKTSRKARFQEHVDTISGTKKTTPQKSNSPKGKPSNQSRGEFNSPPVKTSRKIPIQSRGQFNSPKGKKSKNAPKGSPQRQSYQDLHGNEQFYATNAPDEGSSEQVNQGFGDDDDYARPPSPKRPTLEERKAFIDSLAQRERDNKMMKDMDKESGSRKRSRQDEDDTAPDIEDQDLPDDDNPQSVRQRMQAKWLEKYGQLFTKPYTSAYKRDMKESGHYDAWREYATTDNVKMRKYPHGILGYNATTRDMNEKLAHQVRLRYGYFQPYKNGKHYWIGQYISDVADPDAMKQIMARKKLRFGQ